MLTNYQTFKRSLEHKGGSIKMCYIKKTVRHQGKDKLPYVGFAEKIQQFLSTYVTYVVGTSSSCHLLCTFEDKAKDKNSAD